MRRAATYGGNKLAGSRIAPHKWPSRRPLTNNRAQRRQPLLLYKGQHTRSKRLVNAFGEVRFCPSLVGSEFPRSEPSSCSTPQGTAVSNAAQQRIELLRALIDKRARSADTVTITGSGLSAVSTVDFNGGSALPIMVSDGRI
jgi:hypothetical protein